MSRIDRVLTPMAGPTFTGAGTNYLVQTPTGVLYIVNVNTDSDVTFIKSTDLGTTWTAPTVVFAGTVSALSIWYDRWSNISAGLIHCAYTETGGHDVLYRSINTESADALGTQTTIFDGASAVASNGALSITRARGGNLYCGAMIDAGAEGTFARSTDVGATWAARTDTLNEAAATDQYYLLPGWAADNQDIMAFFWDDSANEISRKLYDDSADTWAETSIVTSCDLRPASNDYPHWAATVDITNSQNLVVAWTNVDLANADLRCFKVTESAITETTTNVVLNSGDDQGFAAIGIDTQNQDWYIFYAGKSDGSETFSSSMNVYYKVSTDDGATWGSETLVSQALRNRKWLAAAPRFSGPFPVLLGYQDGTTQLIALSYPLNRIVPSGLHPIEAGIS